MKIVFFGTSEFAIESLVAINNSSHEILCVVTQPDSRRDRGHKLHFTPIKEKALELGLPIYQTGNINNSESVDYLNCLKADIFVVVSYGALLSKEVLSLSKYKPINVHPSLLPKYRGAAPIQRTLMNGDIITGVTIMEMVEKLDAGDIIKQSIMEIKSEWNYGDLNAMLSIEGGKLLLEALELIEAGEDVRVPQDDKFHSYAKKINKIEKYLNLNHNAFDVVNTIRGLTPKITPILILNNQLLGIVEAEVASLEDVEDFEHSIIGEVLKFDKNKGIMVKCAKGAIWIKKLKPEGKKTMDYKDFINGKKIHIGDILKNKEEN